MRACLSRHSQLEGIAGWRTGQCAPSAVAACVCRACEAEISKLRVDLRTALEAMLQHRMYVQQKLDAAAAVVRQVQQDVQQMPVAMQ